MSRSIHHWQRLAIAAVAVSLVAISIPSVADTRPVDPDLPTTVAADGLPTVQINGVVWQQTVIGSTVYAAGSFTQARPAGSPLGTNEVPRANLLAYDITTGVLKAGFVANLNAQAKTVTSSPDGSRLYVGGDFTSVNGITRNRVAALDPDTGAPIVGFVPKANSTVNAIVATASTVYIGGSFSTLNNFARPRLGAVSTTGTFLPAFAPVVPDGGVTAMVMSPDGATLVVGGSFTSLNQSNNPGYGLGAVNPTTGALLPFAANSVVRDAGKNAGITSLTSDATNVYGTGYVFGAGGVLEGTFSANWSDTKIKWLEDCHGDSYSAYPTATVIYVASHAHFCGNIGGYLDAVPATRQRATAFTNAPTQTVQTNTVRNYHNFAGQPAPTLLDWFPDLTIGTYTGQEQAAWSIAGSGSYVSYGGEFLKVNGVAQQGLVRFVTSDQAPNAQGPRAVGTDFTPTVASVGPGTAMLSWKSNWDRDNTSLTYDVFEDSTKVQTFSASSLFWNRPTLTWTKTASTPGPHTYKVKATDAFLNTITSPIVNFTVQ